MGQNLGQKEVVKRGQGWRAWQNRKGGQDTGWLGQPFLGCQHSPMGLIFCAVPVLVTGAWCSPGRGPADASGALILAALPALVCSLWHSLRHPPASPPLEPSELLASPWLLRGGWCLFAVLTAGLWRLVSPHLADLYLGMVSRIWL